jgi:hypothetical protein
MNMAHLHLLLNHLPVIGTVFTVALLSFGLFRRSPEITRVSLGMLAIVALTAGGVYLTGEPAEEVVEGLPGVTEALIERHEEAALIATVLLGVVGAVALGGLIAFRLDPSRSVGRVGRVVLVLAIAPTAMMARVAYLGGQIRHEEIRPDASQTDVRDVSVPVAGRTSCRSFSPADALAVGRLWSFTASSAARSG